MPNTNPELTAKQIKAGWEQTFSTNNPFCPCDLKSFTKAVNWAERALAATAPNAGAPLADIAKMREALREAECVLRQEDVYPRLHEMIVGALAAAPAQQAGAPLPLTPSDDDYLRWASRAGAKVDWDFSAAESTPRIAFHKAEDWGRFCIRVRGVHAAPQQATLPASEPVDKTDAEWHQFCRPFVHLNGSHEMPNYAALCRAVVALATRAQPQADAAEPVAYPPNINGTHPFDERLAAARAAIAEDRANPRPVEHLYEGTNLWAERQKLQHYDDPLAATQAPSAAKKEGQP